MIFKDFKDISEYMIGSLDRCDEISILMDSFDTLELIKVFMKSDVNFEDIELNTFEDGLYYVCLSDDLSLSVYNALNQYGELYPRYGCLMVPEDDIDECKKDLSLYDDVDVRIWGWSFEQEENECNKCTYNCSEECCDRNKEPITTELKKDDDGNIIGFERIYDDGENYRKFTFYSSNKNDIYDAIKALDI